MEFPAGATNGSVGRRSHLEGAEPVVLQEDRAEVLEHRGREGSRHHASEVQDADGFEHTASHRLRSLAPQSLQLAAR